VLVALLGLDGTRASADGTESLLPRREILERALAAFRRVQGTGAVRTPLLTVIDYSLPSTERRLWVLDPDRLSVLFREFVAHGRGSATEEEPERAIQFGNEPESRRSSLGTFLTAATYTGMHGYSLELIGLDRGVNDRAFERRIVMHPAEYVSAEYRAVKEGRVGRSWGCPALDPAVAPAIIDRIQQGSVIYVAGSSVSPSTPTKRRTPSLTRHAHAGGSRTRTATRTRGTRIAVRTRGTRIAARSRGPRVVTRAGGTRIATRTGDTRVASRRR
jgi:hypothetical protein